MIKITATEILNKRDTIHKTIEQDWGRILVENVIFNNEYRSYDMKALYEAIKANSKEHVTYKLYAQALNMGYSSFDEFPTNSIYPIIFELSEIRDMMVKLNILATKATIDPKQKTKVGKAKLHKNEVLTKAFATKEIARLQKRKLALEHKRDAYNAEAVLTINTTKIIDLDDSKNTTAMAA